MRIVIDLQGAQTESRFRGIGRYSLSLAKAMVKNCGDHEIIIALSGLFPDTIEPIRAAFNDLLPQENIRVWHAPGPVREREADNSWRRNVAERIREAFLADLYPDIVYVTSLFEGEADDGVTSIGVLGLEIPTIVTIFDLIPLQNSEIYLEPVPHYKRHYLRKIEYLRNASALLTISEFTTGEVLETLGFEASNTTNISAACDPIFQQIEIPPQNREKLFKQFEISKPYVMYSGGFDARKNHERLFQAYADMPDTLRNSHQLLIVGKGNTDALITTALSAGLSRNEVIFAGYVSDGDLVQLYNQCTLFVFPSWNEGFGLPVLEAMSCGAAVICSNTSSLPEVIGRKDVLFDPYSKAEITKKLIYLLTDDALRADISCHGIEQAKKFSWDKSAQYALSAFEKFYNTTKDNSYNFGYDAILTKLINSIASIKTIDQHADKYVSIAHAISTSLPAQQHRQLFVDISELAQRDSRTGIQRVTRSILKELLDNPPEGYLVEPVYATINDTCYRYARNFTADFKMAETCGEDEYIEYKAGDIFLGLDLQHHTSRVLSGFLTFMRQQGVKVSFVVYDLLPLQFPHCWPSEHSFDSVHAEWISVISKFDGAICISRTVADELTNWLKLHGPERLRPFKVSWFHLGADVENSAPTFGLPDDVDDILMTLESRTSFLMVGTIEPRKCHAQTLKAFEQLWEEGADVNFIIVGQQGWVAEELINKLKHHSELNKRLFWLKDISDEYLEKVYASSTCLIAASAGEGFGLPLIEAAQHKLPIIARDIPVFREVASQYAYYFKGDSSSELARAIDEWIDFFKEQKHPKSDELPWVTWKECTKTLLNTLLLDENSVYMEPQSFTRHGKND